MSAPSARISCGDCRHYLTDNQTFGTCKRFPPTPLPDGRQALPHTGPNDWCGEGEPDASSGLSKGNSEQMTDQVSSTGDDRVVNNTMRHAYGVLSDAEKAQMQAIKDKGLELHALIEGIGQSRELSLAKTKTEEAVMWAVKHITA